MKIDDNYRIERQGPNFALVHSVKNVRTNTMDSGHFKWKKGEEYITEEESYYSSLRGALVGYVKSCVDNSNEIKDILVNLDQAEKRLKELLYSDYEK